MNALSGSLTSAPRFADAPLTTASHTAEDYQDELALIEAAMTRSSRIVDAEQARDDSSVEPSDVENARRAREAADDLHVALMRLRDGH